jgi:hypothetical protein
MTTQSTPKSRPLSRIRTLARRAHDEHEQATSLRGPERIVHVLRRHHLLRELAGTVHRVDPQREECAMAIDALASYESMCFVEARSPEAVALEQQFGQRLEALSGARSRPRRAHR